MFEVNKPMYMTRVVYEQLSKEHLDFILQYIYEQQPQLTDYLQVFDFYVEDNEQWLIQRQEVPNRETTIFVPIKESELIERKVWVIDQGQEGIMVLFPEDY
ncbi:DUF960 family protein [Metabacillus sp. B2-18]|uniref:DUF960 family protein n=1 Tax=Metabacillus sp. B2-18 TaxID=2897333 RepID=UPI001E58DD5B|nr:DUF960 family protein [Metabacillus sp. B2-18]UGB30586.1 DUF960 domain-containing protein [Metabacillus sp. B2-18]